MAHKKRKYTPDLAPDLTTRAMAPIPPATFDAETGTVRAVAATEAPARVFDWEVYDIVDEVLRMDGCVLPETGQVPLLDSHSRGSVADILGSASMFEDDTAGGHRAKACTVTFSATAEGEAARQKTLEGHLTDYSVGYRIDESTWVPDGQRQIIAGDTYEGPVRVVTRWTLKELSATPIGADEYAKARALAQPRRQHPTQSKESTMNPKLKQLLMERGLAAGATDDDAWAFFHGLPFDEQTRAMADAAGPPTEDSTDPKPAGNDADKIRRDAARAERERCDDIRRMVKTAGLPDTAADDMVRRELTVEAAGQEIFKRMEETKKPTGARARFSIQADAVDKFRTAAETALLIRAGLSGDAGDAGASDLTGFSLRELARESLRVGNLSIAGSPMEMVGRAMLTSDFQSLLRNVAHKSLFAGWETAEETWPLWCAVGEVSDFKTNYSPRASEFSDLDEVPEGMPYKYGKRSDSQESYAVTTYGKLEAITRQSIINDDLNALTGFAAHGEAAARKVGDLPYAVLTANAAMGDGTALFATGHSNYVASGSGAAPGIATLAAGIKAMKTQKDIANLRRLNINPIYFLAPAALEGAAEVFFKSVNYVDSDTVATDSSLAATRTNPYSGERFKRIYDARLDDAVATGWYLAAAKGKTVTVFFLNGEQRPYLEERDGWQVDGVELKVRIDVGAKAMDWRGLYYNYGA